MFKVGVSYLVNSLVVDLKDVDVILVYFGFVKMLLIDKNDFLMLMVVSVEKVVNYIYKGVVKRCKEVYFLYCFIFILKFLRMFFMLFWLKLVKGLLC